MGNSNAKDECTERQLESFIEIELLSDEQTIGCKDITNDDECEDFNDGVCLCYDDEGVIDKDWMGNGYILPKIYTKAFVMAFNRKLRNCNETTNSSVIIERSNDYGLKRKSDNCRKQEVKAVAFIIQTSVYNGHKDLKTQFKHILSLFKSCYQIKNEGIEMEFRRTLKCRNTPRTFVKTKTSKHIANENTHTVNLLNCDAGNTSDWKECLFHLPTTKLVRSLNVCPNNLNAILILRRLRRKQLIICSKKRKDTSHTSDKSECVEISNPKCEKEADTGNSIIKLVKQPVCQHELKTLVHEYFEKDSKDLHLAYNKSERGTQSPINIHKNIEDFSWKDTKNSRKSSFSRVLFEDNFTPAPVKLWVAPFARSNDHTLEAIFSKFTSTTPPTKEESMAYEMLRLCTLHDFPNLNLSYVRLAQAGFYYAGNGDEVICFACGVRKSGWSRDDNPVDVHRQISPNCPFFQNVRLNRPVLYAEDVASQNYLLDTPSGFTRDSNDVPPRGGRNEIDVARPHDSGSYTLENTTVKTLNGAGRDSGYGTYSGSDLAVDNSVATDHDRQRGRDRFPQYSTYDKRLETYKNWPSHLRQNPRELAQAGLFFTNDRDLVKCFRCGTGLYDWQWDDNPWIEHTRLSQECSFIIEVKGQKFIRTVLEAAAEAERREQGDNGNRLSTESRAPRSSSSNASQSQSSSTTSATNNAQKSRTPESTSSGSQSQSSSRTAATNNAQKSRTPESTSSGSQSQSSSRTAATNNAPYDERSTNNQMPSRALRTNTVSNIHTKTSAILAENNTENNTTTNETRNTGSNDRHNFSNTNNQKSASATGVSTASALPNDRRTFGSSTEENTSNQNSVAEASSDAASSSHRAVTGASNGSLSPDLTNDNNSSSAVSNGHVDSTSESDHKQSKKAKKKSRNKKSSKHSPEETSSATSPELNGLDHASNHEEHEESGSSGQSIASRLPEDVENTDPKTLKKQIKEMKDLTICKICLDNKVSVVFLPCGHLVACKQCSRSLRKCPICRKNIKKTVDTQI